MMSSITPVGEHARGQRWAVTVTAHVVGAVVGGAALGLFFGTLGAGLGLLSVELAPAHDAWVLGAIALGALILETGPLAVAVPTVHRQVDERWLDTYRGWVYGGGYGLQLGFGLVTVVPSWATPAMLAAMTLIASPVTGAVVGAVYGLLRALPVLMTARLREPTALWRFHERLDHWRVPAEWVVTTGLALVAVAVVVAISTGATV